MLYIIAPIDKNLVVSETYQIVKRNCCVLLKPGIYFIILSCLKCSICQKKKQLLDQCYIAL